MISKTDIRSCTNKCVLILLISLLANNYVWSKSDFQSLLNQASVATTENKASLYFQLAKMQADKDQKQALDFAEKVILWSKKTNNTDILADALHFMGNQYQNKNDINKAIDCYEQELTYREQKPASPLLARLYSLLAQQYLSNKRKRKSNYYFEKSLETAIKIKSDSLIIKNYEALFRLSYDRKKYQDAVTYFHAYLNMQDSINKLEVKYKIANIVSEYRAKTKNKDRAIDTLLHARGTLLQVKDTQDSRIGELASVVKEKNYEIIRKEFEEIILGFVFLAISLLLFLLYKLYSSKKKSNILLSLKNKEIQRQKEEILMQHNEIELKKMIIEEKNREITSSIQYAKTIQKALLPSNVKMKQYFPSSFVFYKPKDIVSGDFYWLTSDVNKNKIYLAVADCTGHGVPGGFLTMMGIEKLNTIFNSIGYVNLDPALILTRLNEEFQASFGQSEQQNITPDGMDIALCEFDMANGKIVFSGANRPLLLVKTDGSLVEYKSAKKGVGDHFENNALYQNYELEASSGDMIYMFSDGYESQFGGSLNKKLMKKSLRKLLMSICNKDVLYQKEFLHAFFNAWKKEEEQVDDVLVVGIRIP